MKRPCDCILGVREANHRSGVGLFNRLLAERLQVPYRLLDSHRSDIGDPLVSLKFEELSGAQSEALADLLHLRFGDKPFYLFLHTYSASRVEQLAALRAQYVFCGNDAIYRRVQALRAGDGVIAAFAPSLIPEHYRQTCSPGEVEFFYFGMANKIDEARFVRLRDLLAELPVDYRLLCSLAVHQTSDGSCISHARSFLARNFGRRFIFLGTLDDMGIAYFLRRETVFVGFYKDGVRSNNTTFNTALSYGKRIITNLDADSPKEVQSCPRILNIDHAEVSDLARFLAQTGPAKDDPLVEIFSWAKLLARIESAWRMPHAKVA